ncbi:DUF1905 domain-containing protein [Synechococcales cyanobacterium CNB]|nr:DUF1905 domain-containing protein [Leptolyngbya sp.]MDL1903199.1 DUF1905 domain-containing protein [Synechococcales cyanobacterium CNB]
MIQRTVTEAFGSLGRISVVGKVNGFPIKTSIFPNGDGTHHMMFNKAMQKGADATVGDMVEMELELAPGKRPAAVQHVARPDRASCSVRAFLSAPGPILLPAPPHPLRRPGRPVPSGRPGTSDAVLAGKKPHFGLWKAAHELLKSRHELLITALGLLGWRVGRPTFAR